MPFNLCLQNFGEGAARAGDRRGHTPWAENVCAPLRSGSRAAARLAKTYEKNEEKKRKNDRLKHSKRGRCGILIIIEHI